MLILIQDFFYICAGHLTDRGFCQPEAEEAKRVADQKKQEELDHEIEAVKKEYEQKQQLKREKRKLKDKERDKEKEKEEKAKEDDEDKQDEKAKDDKASMIKKSQLPVLTANKDQRALKDKREDSSRPRSSCIPTKQVRMSRATFPIILTLHRSFYQMRLDKLRNAEIAKRNRERLNDPKNFPSVPSGNP